jgi:uncharacterized protein (UPF0333 family)
MVRGQGTIEYLVIIAVVVVISLIVVALVFSQTSGVSETQQRATNLAWKTKELQVVDLVVDSEGKGLILLAGNIPNGATLNRIEIEGASNSSSKKIFFGSSQKISLTDLPACNGKNQKYSVIIYYITKDGLSKSERGEFYADCVSNALDIKSVTLSVSDANFVTNTASITGYLVMSNTNAVHTDLIDNFLEGTNSDSQLEITSPEITLGMN